MSYSQGGLIQASDYNTIVGSNSTTAGTINYVLSTGNGQYGYGQTPLSTVSQAGLVAATQWASAIGKLNSMSAHQTASLNITQPSSGGLVQYLSTVTSGVSQINTNSLSFSSQGATVTGSVFSGSTGSIATGVAYNQGIAARTITFSSGADAARYFFNAGGQLNFVVTAVTNNDGTQRSSDAVTTILTNWGGFANLRATTNGQRTGSGGTLSGTYTSGYYGLTTGNATIATVTSSNATYTSDSVTCLVKSNGVQGSNADTGSLITVYVNYASTHAGAFNDTLNITMNHRIDVVYPELTNLSANTWGAVVIS